MMWRAGLLVRVLLTLSASLVVTGCTERQVHVTGVSGPIVWQSQTSVSLHGRCKAPHARV